MIDNTDFAEDAGRSGVILKAALAQRAPRNFVSGVVADELQLTGFD